MLSGDRFKVEKVGEGLYRLDARGLVCPYPQLLVTRALSNLSQNKLFKLLFIDKNMLGEVIDEFS